MIVPGFAGHAFGAGVVEAVTDVVDLVPAEPLEAEVLVLVPVVATAVFEPEDLEEVAVLGLEDVLETGNCLAARYPDCGTNLTFDPWYNVQVFVDSWKARLSHLLLAKHKSMQFSKLEVICWMRMDAVPSIVYSQ